VDVGVKNPFPLVDTCFFTCVLVEVGGRLTVVGGVANPFRRDVSGRCAFLVEEVGAVWIHLVGSGRNRGFWLVSSEFPLGPGTLAFDERTYLA
jgi:hypothetical protein